MVEEITHHVKNFKLVIVKLIQIQFDNLIVHGQDIYTIIIPKKIGNNFRMIRFPFNSSQFDLIGEFDFTTIRFVSMITYLKQLVFTIYKE